MDYFAHITASYTKKNKAHQEVWDWFKSNNNTLISKEKIDDFLLECKRTVNHINRNNRRCNDICLETFKFDDTTNLKVFGNFQMSIYPVKNTMI